MLSEAVAALVVGAGLVEVDGAAGDLFEVDADFGDASAGDGIDYRSLDDLGWGKGGPEEQAWEELCHIAKTVGRGAALQARRRPCITTASCIRVELHDAFAQN